MTGQARRVREFSIDEWLCCRRSSNRWHLVVCMLDNVLHRLHLVNKRLCDRHDEAIRGWWR